MSLGGFVRFDHSAGQGTRCYIGPHDDKMELGIFHFDLVRSQSQRSPFVAIWIIAGSI